MSLVTAQITQNAPIVNTNIFSRFMYFFAASLTLHPHLLPHHPLHPLPLSTITRFFHHLLLLRLSMLHDNTLLPPPPLSSHISLLHHSPALPRFFSTHPHISTTVLHQTPTLLASMILFFPTNTTASPSSITLLYYYDYISFYPFSCGTTVLLHHH